MAKFTTALTVQLAVLWFGVWSAPSYVEPTCEVLSDFITSQTLRSRSRSKELVRLGRGFCEGFWAL